MTAVLMRARAELRLRWRAWLLLALVLGLSGGVVLTTAAGARRTSSVFDRLVEVTKGHDVTVQVNDELDEKLLARVAGLPQVEAAGRMAMVPADIATSQSTPFSWSLTTGASVDGRVGRALDVPRVVEGRMLNNADPHEAIVNAEFVRSRGLSVGDRFTLRTVTFPELFELFGGEHPTPTGPRVEVKIVGVVQLPEDAEFIAEESDGAPASASAVSGLAFLSPAFYSTYGDQIATLDIMFVKLKQGQAQAASFIEDARRLAGGDQVLGFETLGDQLVAGVEDALRVQSLALWVFTAVVGAAMLLLLGQAIARAISLAAEDVPVLRALGSGSGTLFFAALVPVFGVLLVGAVVAVVAGALGSAAMPGGFARSLEPSPGIRLDWVVLLAGVGAIVCAVLVRAAIAAAWVSRPRRITQRRPAFVPDTLARAGMSPAMVSGTRFALDVGTGTAAVPVRGVMIGVAGAVLAMTAALTFSASFDSLLDDPSAYGWNWDAVAFGGEDPEVLDEGARDLSASPLVAEFSRATVQSVTFRGADLQGLAVKSIKGSVFPRIVEGRSPAEPDEVALGRGTLRDAHARIGGTVDFRGSKASCGGREGCPLAYRVVGRVLFWAEDSSPGEGAVFAPAGLERLAHSEGFSDHLVRLAPGATVQQLVDAFGTSVGDVIGPRPPTEVRNLGRATGLSEALGVALTVVGLTTIALALATSARRRARDLGILKVLGFVRGQVRRTVAWQATFLLSIAVVAGVPAGIAAGRWMWRLLADNMSVAADPSVPFTLLGAGIAGLLVVGNIVAAFPARTAARTQPAVVLRSL